MSGELHNTYFYESSLGLAGDTSFSEVGNQPTTEPYIPEMKTYPYLSKRSTGPSLLKRLLEDRLYDSLSFMLGGSSVMIQGCRVP